MALPLAVRSVAQGDQTSFNSYTFTYSWRIDDLMFLSTTFDSGSFSSPSGARPSTSWMLTVFTNEDTDNHTLEDPPLLSPGEQSLSATLKRLPYQPTLHSSMRTDNSKAVWVEAIIRLQSSNFDHLTEFEPTPFSQGPAELSTSANNEMTFEHCLPLSKVQDSQSIVMKCEIKVWAPKAQPPPTNKPNLRFMEEARRNNLFTDVVLVANGKEYKAHKVVLASHSQFFSSCFSGRWVSPKADGSSGGDERVNLTDVPAVIMEAMLAYMYTGMVENIGSVAHQLLPAAEEYGLVGLRQLCEEELIQSLTSS